MSILKAPMSLQMQRIGDPTIVKEPGKYTQVTEDGERRSERLMYREKQQTYLQWAQLLCLGILGGIAFSK